ncbi:chymotrypsin-like protease CTRL-1 [Drosophila rhopaloa]|uniref:Chymotrypsin-like protease CTRL-1 n=1 Tax=Drosophila rhopaloa TaxID=1041015 RepID=A0A6P4E672_DRORH|nr:chymotrypsin-like protease CTRL-1 [Drosophila rhopaloa]
MKSFVFPLALFFLAFRQDGIAQLLDANCYFQLSPRIFHGTNARLGTTPWIAVISNTTQDLCGGTLIHSRFILTAAHCIKENNQLFVRLGLYDKSCPSWRCTEVEKYSVINSIPHHQYNALSMKNDIGILKLDRQVVYNAQIRPICIFFGIEIDQWSIVHFSAYGWGKTENEGTSSILKTINLSRRSQPCFWSDRETQICAGADKGDTCTGDSGGPLVANITYRGNNFRSQVGIVSFGSTDCNSNGIYTNISSYKQWIKDTISEKDRDQERFLDEDCGNTPQKQGSIRQPWKVNILPSYANGALITKRIVLTVASHLDTDVQKM